MEMMLLLLRHCELILTLRDDGLRSLEMFDGGALIYMAKNLYINTGIGMGYRRTK
jgi:hypothetical protein